MHILVAGGAGFIGSHFVDRVLETYPDDSVTVVDCETYAGNFDNLKRWFFTVGGRMAFLKADIADRDLLETVFANGRIDAVVNFAAESHVDRSLLNSSDFLRTNVLGLHVLLELARKYQTARFVQVSTDEVYGQVLDGRSTENDRLDPRSPYSSSKAAGDHLARSYHVSFGLPVMVTRGSNTYGPRQYPEKLVPLMATNALLGEPLPVYGDGKQVRDWLHVTDHCSAIDLVLRQGTPGEIYNIGGDNLRENWEIVGLILQVTGASRDLLTHVEDRAGHDRRYHVDSGKIERELGWHPQVDFTRGMVESIRWYVDHPEWWQSIRQSDGFKEYYQLVYGQRLAATGGKS